MEAEQIMEMLKVMQEKADAYRKADQKKADADRKANREELQDMMKANQEDFKSGQAKMIAAIKGKMDGRLDSRKDDRLPRSEGGKPRED
jgi:hypothetical protein